MIKDYKTCTTRLTGHGAGGNRTRNYDLELLAYLTIAAVITYVILG